MKLSQTLIAVRKIQEMQKLSAEKTAELEKSVQERMRKAFLEVYPKSEARIDSRGVCQIFNGDASVMGTGKTFFSAWENAYFNHLYKFEKEKENGQQD